jgi:hypothetical protein
MADVVLTDLSMVFPGGTVALDHVDLTVADGESMLAGSAGLQVAAHAPVVVVLVRHAHRPVAVVHQRSRA